MMNPVGDVVLLPIPYFSPLARTGCQLRFAFAFIFDWFLPIASRVISINYDSLLILVAQHLNVQQDLAGSYVQFTIYTYIRYDMR